jgi:hypothetical protein
MKNRKTFYITLLCVLFLAPALAQNITFGGSSFTITENAEIHVPGDVTFVAETNIQNDGDIFVGGDWMNLSAHELEMQNGSGTVIFNGLFSHMIGGTERTLFSHADLQRHVYLDIETRVYGGLQLSSSILTLNKHNLFMMPGAEISGAGEAGYIDASSEGFLVQQVANQDVVFPVGNADGFLPALVKNQGVADNYGMQVFNDVLTGGTVGNTIPEVEDCVIVTWNLIEENPGGSLLDLSFQWGQAVEGSSFNRSLSAVGHFAGDAWIPSDPGNAMGTGPWQQSVFGVTSPGPFAIGDPESPMAVTIVYDEQEITISEGWSGISSYLNPVNPEFEMIFSEVMDEIVIVQDFFDVYWPSQGINTLGTWNTYSGYQVKMSGEVTINFAGTPMVNTTLNLEEGWNLFPILINCKTEPEELFAGTSAVIVREVAGTAIYWPQYNINTLELLFPGSTYMVYMENAQDVDFPECKKSGLTDGNMKVDRKIIDPITNKEISKSNLHHSMVIESAALKDAGFNIGDYMIAVNENGVCFGTMQWDGGNASLIVFGDDLTTTALDGFVPDEKIYLKHFISETQEINQLNPEFDFGFNSHNGLFQNNGISAIIGFKSEGFADAHKYNMTIFPNPADDFIRIQGIFQNADISITDVQGSQQMFYRLHQHHEKLDISGLHSGVYLVEIRIDGAKQLFRERLIVK